MLKITNEHSIRQLYKKRRTMQLHGLCMFYCKNYLKQTRVVICTTRGFPGAVIRNRRRRIVREAYQKIKERINLGYDILIQVRNSYLADSLQETENVLIKLVRKSHLQNHED